MSNPLHPDEMSPAARRAELAAIVAAGVMRMVRLKSSAEFPNSEQISLDFVPEQSGPVANPAETKDNK